jgi:single-stranded-DNA-specific exonuclease
VNPKLGTYPFPDLCGTATVFKLAQALLNRGSFELTPGWEKWWLDMVGIATIADMVPLVGENRVFAHYGLQVLRKSRRPGLQQLLKKAKADQRYLTEDDIGFTIGPRINAASRMDTPEDAFFMLSETDLVKAGERVEHLEKLNTDRKTQVALMTRDLHKRLKLLEEIPSVLVMGHNDWRPSLVGLAAAKLAEEHNRPVFLWGKDGNGVYKGSCRSGGGVSVVKLMQAVSEVFHEHGGHHVAGGFSIKDEHIFNFGERLVAAMDKLGDTVVVEAEVIIDAEIKLEEVNELLIQQLTKLSPFGMGNPKPIFAFRNVTPQAVELFGKTKEHTKLIFQIEQRKVEAIAFFQIPEHFTKTPAVDTSCTMIGHVEQSFFMGRMQLRIRIIDIV